MKAVFKTRSLCKAFGGKTALSEVTVACQPGQIVGLLGPNGSGKTTLLRLASGLAAPTAGEVLTFGRNAAELEAEQLGSLGFVQQEMDLLEWLSGRDHLDYVASFYANWDRSLESKLIQRFAIATDVKVGALSTGERQKLSILLALCHRPKLLLLDEPANALDPNARAGLLRLLGEIARDQGTAIIVSSHLLVDVEKIIDQVWFLSAGRIVANEELDSLKESYAAWTVQAKAGATLPERFDDPFVLSQSGDRQQRLLQVRDPQANRNAFESRYQLVPESRPLNLEAIYPLLAG